jgi:bifunctional ADP-heptose synthase (sugar kinase/adenylyltransferase)
MSTTVAVGGDFNVLDSESLSLLKQAAAWGDTLTVLLDNDDAIAKRAGNWAGNRFAQREKVLREKVYVKEIVSIAETTPCRVLHDLKPNIWVRDIDKGEYLGPGGLRASDVVENYGGRVITVNLP